MTMYQDYAKKAADFWAFTGYTRVEFDVLLSHFEHQFYERMKTHRLDGKRRGNCPYSNYHNSPLPTSADKLFFILHYLKTHNLQVVQGALFQMSQSTANMWVHCWHPLLNRVLVALGELPARDMPPLTWPVDKELRFFHDGTERPIPRPREAEPQRQYYSGKKKRHGLKNNVLSDLCCKICFLSDTVTSKKHDKKLADETGYILPAGSKLAQDTGFQGFTLDHVTILQPQKKPRGGTLTAGEKSINQWPSALRVHRTGYWGRQTLSDS